MDCKPIVAVIGSYMADFVAMAPRLPKPGETVSGGPFFRSNGGKGSNQAVAAARLGADVRTLLSVGDDDLGKRAIEFLTAEGIDTHNVRIQTGISTGVALIAVDEIKGENQIVISPGANSLLSAEDIDASATALECADCLLIQLEIPLDTVSYALEWSRKRGVMTILNPAPYRPLDRSILDRVDVITPNEHEASQLSGIVINSDRKAFMAASKILELGCRVVVITLGERGALIADKNASQLVPTYKVRAVDTTGAGDAFNGALAFAMASRMSLLDSVKFANACASIAVTRKGAATSMPSLAELVRFQSSQIGLNNDD